MQKMSPQLSL